MNAKYQTPPAASLDALKGSANNVPPSHDNMTQLLEHMHDFPQEHNPHRIYAGGLKDMSASGGLSKATIVGWRYLSISGSAKRFAVEVHHDPDGSNHHFAGVIRGPAIEQLVSVIEDDRIRHQIDNSDLLLSTFSIPALDVSAVWLRATSDSQDMIIVVPPAPPFLKPWPDTYTVQQFEDAVRDVAASSVKVHATVFA